MIVCVCHRVSDRDIAREARAGCSSFEELQDELRVGTGCGACLDCAQTTFSQHRAHASGPCHAWPAGHGPECAPAARHADAVAVGLGQMIQVDAAARTVRIVAVPAT